MDTLPTCHLCHCTQPGVDIHWDSYFMEETGSLIWGSHMEYDQILALFTGQGGFQSRSLAASC